MKTRTMWLAIVVGIAVVGFAVFHFAALQRDLRTARAQAAESERLRTEVDALRREREVWKVQAEELRLRRRQAAEVHRLRGEAARRAQSDRAGEAPQTPDQAAEITGDTDSMAGSQSDEGLSMDLDQPAGTTWGTPDLADELEEGMGFSSEVFPEGFTALTNWSSGVIRVWDVASGETLTEYFGGEGITWAEFSAEGTRVIASDLEGGMDVLDWPVSPESSDAEELEDREPTP